MDVEVRVLTKPLRVPDYREYGAKRDTAKRLPAGTYYVPMAQAQKHWVQAMLGEDSYVPFPYFYDVTAWSGPLLNNVAGGRSGVVLHPRSKPAPLLPARRSRRARARQARRRHLAARPDSTSAYESEGWMRYLYDDKWKLPYTQHHQRLDRRRLAGRHRRSGDAGRRLRRGVRAAGRGRARGAAAVGGRRRPGGHRWRAARSSRRSSG